MTWLHRAAHFRGRPFQCLGSPVFGLFRTQHLVCKAGLAFFDWAFYVQAG